MCVESVIVITIRIELESETQFAFRRGGCCFSEPSHYGMLTGGCYCSEPSYYAMLTLLFLNDVLVVKTICSRSFS